MKVKQRRMPPTVGMTEPDLSFGVITRNLQRSKNIFLWYEVQFFMGSQVAACPELISGSHCVHRSGLTASAKF